MFLIFWLSGAYLLVALSSISPDLLENIGREITLFIQRCRLLVSNFLRRCVSLQYGGAATKGAAKAKKEDAEHSYRDVEENAVEHVYVKSK